MDVVCGRLCNIAVHRLEKVKDVKIKSDQAAFVQQDLFLLENQLPFQLLDYLVENTQNSEDRKSLKTSIQSFINMHSRLDEDTPHLMKMPSIFLIFCGKDF